MAHTIAVSDGRTRSIPGKSWTSCPSHFASCQNYEAGYFTPYQHMAQEILTSSCISAITFMKAGCARVVRRRTGKELTPSPTTAIDMRLSHRSRFAARSRLFPWIRHLGRSRGGQQLRKRQGGERGATGQVSRAPRERVSGVLRAHAATPGVPAKGSSLRLYRRLAFGDLAEFSVLDTRQYRTDQPCGDGNKPQCPEALAVSATLMGRSRRMVF